MADHDFDTSPFELLARGNTSSSDKSRSQRNSATHSSGQSKYRNNFNGTESTNNTSCLHYDTSEQSKSQDSDDGDMTETQSRSWNLVRAAARQSIDIIRGNSLARTQLVPLIAKSPSQLLLLRKSSNHADDEIFADEASWATGPMLGRGSYGKVYKSTLNENKHAIKVMIVRESELSKVITEAEVGCMLAHPTIVRTSGYQVMEYTDDFSAFMPSSSSSWVPIHCGDSRDRVLGDKKFKMYKLALIQELCDVGPLRDAIPRAGFFERPDIRKLDFVGMISMDICRALMHFESEGIRHNDLSSNNVLLATDPSTPLGMRAKLIDFGLCRPHSSSKVVGTISYTSPELLVGDLTPNGSKTDVYSLGVLMLEMWIGKEAWCPLEPMQIVYRLSIGKRLSVPEDVPEPLRRLLERCLSDNIDERPSAHDAYEALRLMTDPSLALGHQITQCSIQEMGLVKL